MCTIDTANFAANQRHMLLCSLLGEKYTNSHLKHVATPTRSSYFHMRRLRAISIVSSHVFTYVLHTVLYSRIDYCNSLMVYLTEVRLYPLQSVLKAAARLIA